MRYVRQTFARACVSQQELHGRTQQTLGLAEVADGGVGETIVATQSLLHVCHTVVCHTLDAVWSAQVVRQTLFASLTLHL